MLVKDIVNNNVYPVNESLTIRKALEELIEKHFNGVLVFNENKKLVGILSLQDIAAATIPLEMRDNTNMVSALATSSLFSEMCQDIANKKVSELMRKEFITVGLETNVMEVAADFLKNDLYIIPVIEKNEVIGVITRSEIKKALFEGMKPQK